MSTVISIRGAKHAPKSSQSKMETIIITQPIVNQWKIPPFQRPLRINAKVQSVSEKLTESEVVEGVLTLGMLRSDPSLYIVDGQHRVEAFRLSGLDEAIADVRVVVFTSMADMAEEFVQLNSSLVKMRPDDILRGLESSIPLLRQIRNSCGFVGYDQIRRGGSSPVLSMSAVLRCWSAAQFETPSATGTGVTQLAQCLEEKSVNNLIAFLSAASAAWGRDPEYYRLWGNANLSLCMWLWVKLVIDRDRSGPKRYALLDIPTFKKCLMSVSADSDYVSWLVGRNMSDRDRSPNYRRLRSIFQRRLATERKDKKLPAPAWYSNSGSSSKRKEGD
jgi:hypothetical protein